MQPHSEITVVAPEFSGSIPYLSVSVSSYGRHVRQTTAQYFHASQECRLCVSTIAETCLSSWAGSPHATLDRCAENLMMPIRQKNAAPSQKAGKRKCKNLREEEVTLIKGAVNEAFAGF
jgi:hypothetical protein